MKLALPSSQALPVSAAGVHLPPDTQFDIRRIAKVFLSRLPLLCVAVAACLGGALYYLDKTPRMYASNAVLEVKQHGRGISNLDGGSPSEMNALEEQHTFEQSLTNRTLLIAVARALKLDEDTRLFPNRSGGQPLTDAQVSRAMAPLVQAELRRGTRLIDLKTTYFDADTAKEMADKVIELFVEQGASMESGASLKASGTLTKEAERLRLKLTESEKTLQQFKEKNSGIPQDQGYNLSLERLKELNVQFSKAKGLRLQLETDMAKLDGLASSDPVTLLQASSIAGLPEVVELQKMISVKEAEFSVLKEWCSFKHPRFVQAQKELDYLTTARAAASKAAAKRVRTSYETALESETKLQAAIAAQERISLDLSKQAIPFAQLQNEVKADRELYESVTRRLKETEVSASIAAANFRVSESPIVQPDAVSPRRTQILGLALLAGLLLGGLGAFGLEVFNPAAPPRQPNAPAPEIPVLAELPVMTDDRLSLALDCSNRRNTPACEAFRTLRASLSFLRRDREPRSVVVTGALDDGEANHCALNLAATYAGEGLRTLLIEVDFKSIELEKLLLDEYDGPVPGLTEGLAGGLAINEFCHTTRIANLYLIPAGKPVAEPAALLVGSNFRELMMLAWNSLDRIVLSAPSVGRMPEPLVPLRYAEAVCLVARSARNNKAPIATAVKRLRFPGHAPVGLILTGAPSRFTPSLRGDTQLLQTPAFTAATSEH